MGLTVGGLNSGLDTEGMITKLMAIEAQPITQLNSKEVKAQAKISAWGTVKNAVAAFQTATQTLQTATAFNQPKGTSSHSDVATITTTSGSAVGSINIEVSQLAKAGKATLIGTYASNTTVVNPGAASTMAIHFGTTSGTVGSGATFVNDPAVSPKNITIRANATLEQAVTDINSASAGVNARIVSTPSGKRVVMESTATGSKTDFRAMISGSIDNQFAYDPINNVSVGNELVRGQNAQYKIDDVAISASKNTITDALTGSTITLNKVSTSGVKTSVSVTRDSEGVKTQLESFVKAFNEMNTTLRSVSAYGASPGKGQAPVGGGALSGDPTIRAIQTEVRNMFNQPIPGAPKGYSSMVDIGVTFAKDGTLSLDSTTLSTALTNNADGVRQLLMGRAQFSQSGFTALNSNSLTKTGSYGIEITSTPSKAKLVSSSLGGATIPTNFTVADNTLKLNIDGTIVTANLYVGPGYSSKGFLASSIQDAINASLPSTRQVTVAYDSGADKFEITSGKAGSISKVEVLSGTTLPAAYGFSVGAVATGTSLAGKIGGITALSDDDSMSLIGATGSGATGLKFRVDDATLGSRGTVSFATGFAYNLGGKLSTILSSSNGAIVTRTNGLNSEINQIDDRRTRMNNKLSRMETTLRKQFTAMDLTVGKYNQLSTYLSSQLQALVGSTSNK